MNRNKKIRGWLLRAFCDGIGFGLIIVMIFTLGNFAQESWEKNKIKEKRYETAFNKNL